MIANGQDLITEFISREAEYLQFGTAMNSLITRLITIEGINTHSVHFRVKEKKSLSEKIDLKNKYNSLNEITVNRRYRQKPATGTIFTSNRVSWPRLRSWRPLASPSNPARLIRSAMLT